MTDNILKVKDIMTSGWIATLNSEDNIIQAAKLFGEYNYDGFPVIDKNKKLVGIITAYEMVNDSTIMYLSNLREVLQKISEDRAGISEFEECLLKPSNIKVEDIMNSDPLTVTPDLGVDDLAREFAKHHRVNPIPVVDRSQLLAGVVSRFDLIKFFDSKYLDQILVSSGHESILQKIGQRNINNNKNDK